MARYRSRNHEIDARWKKAEKAAHRKGAEFAAFLSDVEMGRELRAPFLDDRRSLIYDAVRRRLDDDNKRPWSLGQKLNDVPYRYTRDTLWAALNSISARLAADQPSIDFGVEDDFTHPKIKSYAEFVNTQLTKTVSSLINGIMDASRWA